MLLQHLHPLIWLLDHGLGCALTAVLRLLVAVIGARGLVILLVVVLFVAVVVVLFLIGTLSIITIIPDSLNLLASTHNCHGSLTVRRRLLELLITVSYSHLLLLLTIHHGLLLLLHYRLLHHPLHLPPLSSHSLLMAVV